jgi:SpoVK/Ycf46/Vps4 family AAA+-type ATPase
MTIVADEHTERVFPCYLPTQLYCPNGKSNKKKPKHNMNTHKTAKAKTTNKMQNKKSNNPSKQMPKLNKILFKDIAGLDSVKKAFDDKVIFPLKNKKMFKKYKMKSGGGILLYGLPGTGKTMFAQAAANEVDAKFISIKCSDIMSQ